VIFRASGELAEIEQMPGTMQFFSGYSPIGWPSLSKCLNASMWVPAWSGIDMNIEDSRALGRIRQRDSSCVFQTPWITGGWPG